MLHAQTVSLYSFFPHLSNFICFLCASCVFIEEKHAFRLHNLEKGIQSTCVFVLTCGKSVWVECSIAEEKEVILGWEANRLPAVCWSCCRCRANEFFSENCHPSDEIEPTALNLWKRNISVTSNQLVRELACDWNNRQINKHTWARNLFFNTTSVKIWCRNSLLCCLSFFL